MPDTQIHLAVGLKLPAMRALVRRGLGNLTAEDADDEYIDQLLNMSYWEIEKKYQFKEKECRIQWPTTIGIFQYKLPNEVDLVQLEAIQAVSILDENNVSHPLERMSQSWWDTVYSDAGGTTFRALPRKYVRMDQDIILHPTPDKVYTVRIFLLKTLKTLLDDTFEQPDVPRNWHELVVEGALSRGLLYKQDINMAQQVHAFQTSKIRSAVAIEGKEERDSHYAGLEVLWEAPSPE